MNKADFRRLLKNKIQEMNLESFELMKQGMHQSIDTFFSHFPHFMQLQGASFLAMRKELGLENQRLQVSLKKPLAFPTLVDGQMVFGIGDVKSQEVWLEKVEAIVEPDWVLVPGLAFSLKGGRLGRGGGFYDQALGGKKIIKIGVTSVDFLDEKIPLETHDVLMDFIITEKFCWDVSRQVRL